jgi:redox-sensing transcriptional repressor
MEILLPEKTVERLSVCRRILQKGVNNCKEYIFSHELASLMHITPVQVRRDIMLMGYSAIPGKGYKVNKLIRSISKRISHEKGLNVAIVGVGKLGHALLRYLVGQNSNLKVCACFDIDPNKIGIKIGDVDCFHIADFEKIAIEKKIAIGVITVNQEAAEQVKEKMVKSGIKGILNYTATSLKVPDDVFIEQHDIVTSLEKISYFVKASKKNSKSLISDYYS